MEGRIDTILIGEKFGDDPISSLDLSFILVSCRKCSFHMTVMLSHVQNLD